MPECCEKRVTSVQGRLTTTQTDIVIVAVLAEKIGGGSANAGTVAGLLRENKRVYYGYLSTRRVASRELLVAVIHREDLVSKGDPSFQ